MKQEPEFSRNKWGLYKLKKRNVTRKFKTCTHSIMANLNLGQDVANKIERK